MYKIRTVVAISDRLTRGPLLHRMALRDGFELLAESKNGLDALALAKRHHPQLLITDILPSCAENVALLKRLVEHRPRMRVMLISPYYTDWMSQQMCDKNIDVFFSVPFISDFLLDRCEAFCAPNSYSEDPTSLLAQCAAAVLDELGMPSHLTGYQYLSEAVAMSVSDASPANAVTKVIYPTVARRCGSTASCVERAIRNAIDVTWQRGKQSALQKYFAGGDKPTNGTFIFTIAEHLRAKYLRGEFGIL